MKKQNKYLDLTNNNYKAQKQWQHVGLKQSKIKMNNFQKTVMVVAIINIPIPLTFSPATSPLMIKAGDKLNRKVTMKGRVKLQ